MRHRKFLRLCASALALSLALTPLASALTVDEARDLLQAYYIDPIPEDVLGLGSIEEITAALGDPYTYYMSAEEYQAFQTDLNDTTVVGIGVMVEKQADGMEVILIAPGGPAEGAGIQLGDKIVAVDGTTLEEAGTADALSLLIAGEAGSEVTITVLRSGKSLDITMKRAEVTFPVVTGEVVDGHIGWIDVTSFGENTGDYFQTYITDEDEQADRWVVDLRGNPGGYATAVIAAAGYVLGNQTVAHVVDNQGNYNSWRMNIFPVEIPGLIEEPLIVITDGASASASELFAAAMRDHDYALIIGTRTFGKGVAQNVFEQEDGSAMKITTDRYYSPRWVTPDRSGVVPHLVVDPNLADGVAYLLSGKEAKKASADVLVLELTHEQASGAEDAPAPEVRKWYVHKDAATSAEYAPAFAELLSAIAPNTPMTLNGKAVTPADVAKAWKVEYTSRWFDDVADSPYADEINTLAALGMLSGDENGDFNPKGELTRAELAAFLTQAMGYWCWESQGRAPYADVTEEDWFSTSADILYHLGLMRGDDAGNFNPDDLIDYQQFITVLMRAGAWSDMTLKSLLAEAAPTALYDEQPALLNFSAWAQPAVAAASDGDSLSWEGGYQSDTGLLLQPLEEVDPAAVVTREEAAAMLYNLLTYSYIIQPVAG